MVSLEATSGSYDMPKIKGTYIRGKVTVFIHQRGVFSVFAFL